MTLRPLPALVGSVIRVHHLVIALGVPGRVPDLCGVRKRVVGGASRLILKERARVGAYPSPIRREKNLGRCSLQCILARIWPIQQRRRQAKVRRRRRKMRFTCLPLGVNVVNGVADQLVSVVFGFQWKSTVRVRQTQEAGEIPKQPFVALSRGILRVR
jgi:hypothetical protein